MRRLFVGLLTLLALAASPATADPLALNGNLTQGGLVFGTVAPGSRVMLDGRTVRVSAAGRFVFGFGRDAPPSAALRVVRPDGAVETRTLSIAPRDYNVQHIEGLPPKMVTPPEDVLARIRRENEMIAAARAQDRAEPLFDSGFIWPAQGIITGVYGSQRVLNGEPRRPHYGIDIAAPAGTPVVSPADAVVTLAETDLYYTGGTLILDHGHGLSSAMLHMKTLSVSVGQRVRQGDPLGTVGAGGRATGPHLDWRINWFDQRVDPAFLVPPMPAQPATGSN